MRKFLFPVLIAALFFATPRVGAATFEEGLALYRAGDYEGAMAVWLPLAEAGDRDAQYRYGGVFRDGKGRPINNAIAVEWFQKSALQGQVEAQTELGFMFDYGDGLPQDREKAKCWYLLAAEQGYPQGQFNLANILNPLEGPRSRFHWTLHAARQGHPRAMAIIGRDSWELGLNNTRALMYLLLAAERGDAKGIKYLAEALQGLTNETRQQLSAAKKRAAAWEPVLEEPPASPSPVPDECLP